MKIKLSNHTYLFWLWRETGPQWRASLDDPRTGKRLAFATTDQLFEYLTQTLLAELPKDLGQIEPWEDES